MSTSFQILLGKFNANIFSPDSGSILKPILFVSFNISIVFIMINIMITILVEHYQTARVSNELDIEDPGLFNYMKCILDSIVCFLKPKQAINPLNSYMTY
jgi:hypothetical protein